VQVFNRPEKGFNVDETNADGESTLHLCARRGDAQRVELLVESGADLFGTITITATSTVWTRLVAFYHANYSSHHDHNQCQRYKR